MSAPERIYLDGDAEAGDGYFTRGFETAKPCSEPAIEYVRADLCTLSHEERVARLVKVLQAWDQYDKGPDDGPNAGVQMMLDYDRAMRLTRAALRDMGVE